MTNSHYATKYLRSLLPLTTCGRLIQPLKRVVKYKTGQTFRTELLQYEQKWYVHEQLSKFHRICPYSVPSFSRKHVPDVESLNYQ